MPQSPPSRQLCEKLLKRTAVRRQPQKPLHSKPTASDHPSLDTRDSMGEEGGREMSNAPVVGKASIAINNCPQDTNLWETRLC